MYDLSSGERLSLLFRPDNGLSWGPRVGIRLFYGLIISWLGRTYTVDVATNQARGVDVMEKLDDCVV